MTKNKTFEGLDETIEIAGKAGGMSELPDKVKERAETHATRQFPFGKSAPDQTHQNDCWWVSRDDYLTAVTQEAIPLVEALRMAEQITSTSLTKGCKCAHCVVHEMIWERAREALKKGGWDE